MLKLKVQLTKRLTKAYDVIDGMIIGRDSSCQIQILNPGTSRQHARLDIIEGGIIITDMGSSNGIRVNDKKVQLHRLVEGDIVRLGTVTLYVEKETPLPSGADIIKIDELAFTAESVKHLVSQDRLAIEFNTVTEQIEKGWRIGEQFLLARNFPIEEHERFVIALREAIGNAERHGNKREKDRRIRVYLMDTPEELCVAIEDEGEGFDYQQEISATSTKDALSAARERAAAGGHGGLGIRLMLKCVDRIEYEHKGCRILLKKFKKPPTPEEKEESKLTAEEEDLKTHLMSQIEDSRDLVFIDDDDDVEIIE